MGKVIEVRPSGHAIVETAFSREWETTWQERWELRDGKYWPLGTEAREAAARAKEGKSLTETREALIQAARALTPGHPLRERLLAQAGR